MASSPALPARFIALDIRTNAVMIGAVDARQHVALTPRQVALGALESWGRLHLRSADALVIAAPSCVWQLHDQLAPLVASITIAHPQLSSLLPALRTSAGARDAIALARLHAAGLVPALWAPPAEVRDLRALTAQRRRLLNQRSAARTLLHELLRRYHLTPPGSDRLAADQPDWWETRGLAPDDMLRARAGLCDLNRVPTLLTEAEADLEQRASMPPWRAPATALLHDIPGMRRLDASILLAEIGAVARFPSADKLAAYAGLAGNTSAAVYNGRHKIRSTMLEIARAAVHEDATWQATFAALAQRAGRDRAIVATARKLLVLVWETLTTYVAMDDQLVRQVAA
ncbi:MAG: transposase [Roseiflexaceae bacterium]